MIETIKEFTKIILIGTCALIAIAIYSKLTHNSSYMVTHTYGSNVYEVDLTSQVQEDHDSYMELARLLRSLNKSDTVIFNMHSYGGSVATTQILINAMVESKAHTIANVIGPSYSAGAFISCAADELKMSKYSYLMFHSPRSQSGLVPQPARGLMLGLLQECVNHNILSQEQVDSLNNSGSDDVEIYIKPLDLTKAPKLNSPIKDKV